MKVAVLRETFPGEKRVALIPASVPQLAKAGIQVLVQSGAGEAAGYPDAVYQQRGAELVEDRQAALDAADVFLQVHCLGANPEAGKQDIPHFRAGLSVIGMCDPLGAPDAIQQIAETGASLFALELIPRITRAQSMDVLSSMATIAGYRAVLLAASELPKLFPMMMTAAGTIKAARAFVIGAGVAGLQAIATAKRLGAIVHAYDVRPACREQVESLGGKFVELELETQQSEDQGGYAKQLDEAFYEKQRELMARVVSESDVVITTAAIPGKQSPLLITRAAVEGMAPGSVIVDLAAERGGNCEPSQAGQRIVHQGVVIHGPTNLVSEAPFHASQMYSNNITRFLLNMVKDGQLAMDMQDEIVRDTCVAHGGQVNHPRIRELLQLPPLTTQEEAEEKTEEAEASPTDDAQSQDPPPQG